MSASELTEAIAEITREYERQSSGVLRHFQWHEEMATELVRFLPDSGYSIVPTSDVASLNAFRTQALQGLADRATRGEIL